MKDAKTDVYEPNIEKTVVSNHRVQMQCRAAGLN